MDKVNAREALSYGLSAYSNELRLFWRESGMTCRWLVPDSKHCMLDDEILKYLSSFLEDSDKIINVDVRDKWVETVSGLLVEEADEQIPVSLMLLTWLLRVTESPHRDDLEVDDKSLYLWNIRVSDLALGVSEVFESSRYHLSSMTLVDLDTLASQYYELRKEDYLALASEEAEEVHNRDMVERFNRLRRFKNLVFYGIGNVGKANLSKQLIQNWKRMTGRQIGMHCVTVFHSGVHYDDLVERYSGKGVSDKLGVAEFGKKVAVKSEHTHGGHYFFEPCSSGIEDGLFLALCKEAAQNPDKDYLFMIEYINAARLSVVLGEVSHMLDSFARVPWRREDGGAWDLEVAGARSVRLQKSGRLFFVPGNVYIVGTAMERDFFVNTEEELLQSFAVEQVKVLDKEGLSRAMLGKGDFLSYLRLDAYVKHSVDLWHDINEILGRVGGHAELIGYGPLFSMCDEILASSDVHEAARIVLGTWRYRMLPPLLMRISQLLEVSQDSYHRELQDLLEVINRSWIRTRLELEGMHGSESIRVVYEEI